MRRLPITLRLTAAFAAAMLLVLLSAALFVALRLRADLDDQINNNLRGRNAAALNAYREGTNLAAVAVEDPEESFVQLIDDSGTVLETAGDVIGPAVLPAELRRALLGALVVERSLPGIDGPARMLLVTVIAVDGRQLAIVTGQSLLDRNEALSSVVNSFLWGGVTSLVLASAVGYGLAKAGLAPVEAMRRRAAEISMSGSSAGLPLPPARDELRRLGVTLNAMLGRIRESFEREGRFVADASHELRTPLAVMRTELDGALLTRSAEPDVRVALLAVRSECDRLTRLADDLLVLARYDNGRLPLRITNVQISALFDMVRDRYADLAAESGRFIALEAPSGTSVQADPDRLRQVLNNLLDNAIRHGDGDIALRVAELPDGVDITVSDQGPGFPVGFRNLAFERFSRADLTRGDTGAGLGLALVQAIAVAHGGRAWISGTNGTTVHLWLPNPHAHLISAS
jgi:two-component system, OmpR family, sensor kinase